MRNAFLVRATGAQQERLVLLSYYILLSYYCAYSSSVLPDILLTYPLTFTGYEP